MTDRASGLGLLLCADRAAGSSLEGVLHALQSRQPGLAVFAEPELCRHRERVAARVKDQRLEVVVVGTSHRACARLWPEVMTRAGISPFDVHVVPLDPAATPGRAEALLWGRLCRALIREPVPPECVKTRVFLPRGPISRRRLLTSALPRSITVPAVDRRRCRSRQGCRRCTAACPLGALGVEAGALMLDRTRCEGCGLCVKACPVEAIRLPPYGWPQLVAEIEGVLSVPDAAGIAVFHCQDVALDDPPRGLFLLALPCAGMLPAWLLLRTLAAGALAALVLPGGDRCRGWHQASALDREVRVGRMILEFLGIDPDRLQILATPQELPGAVEQVGRLAPLSVARERLEGAVQGPARLAALVKAMADSAGVRPAGGRSSEELPFGLVSVAGGRCTLCGVCASVCPTSALEYREEPGRAVLAFDGCRCDGCRACVPVCPEKALAVSRTLDPAALQRPPRLLAEAAMARCGVCGREFAPIRLCQRVQEQLSPRKEGIGSLGALARYCPSCRMVATSRARGRLRTLRREAGE